MFALEVRLMLHLPVLCLSDRWPHQERIIWVFKSTENHHCALTNELCVKLKQC